jgi:3-hydroxyisobutyrate dehydrogenase-like beta-hydroxyacid dehydrogenase
MADIGFIGLGTMGAAMARRLIGAGHTVHVWNRTASAVDELVDAGAVRATTVSAALSTGLVFSMLANDDAVDGTFSPEVLATAPSGSVHVNHATVSVAAADRFALVHAEAGVRYVAAPVLGRSSVAAAGQLNIVVAGPATAIEQVRPFLDVLGKHTWIIGERASKASLVKIGVNFNLIHALQSLSESITLMEQGGVDSSTFVEILTDAAFTGSAYRGYGDLIARRAYTPPGFTVGLGLKDLSLAEQAAADLGAVLPSAPVLRDIFTRALADPDLASLDWSAIAEITRGLAHNDHSADSGRNSRS